MSMGLVKGYVIVSKIQDNGFWFLSHYADPDLECTIWAPDHSTAFIYLSAESAKKAARKQFGLSKSDFNISLVYREDRRDGKPEEKRFGFIVEADGAE